MKYIRTKGGIYELMFSNEEQQMSFDHKTIEPAYYTTKNDWIAKKDVIKQSDHIEELCDDLVIKYKNKEKPRYIDMTELLKACKDVGITFREHIEWLFNKYKDRLEICNLAIWTDKGLIYVAKMNDKGDIVLL